MPHMLKYVNVTRDVNFAMMPVSLEDCSDRMHMEMGNMIRLIFRRILVIKEIYFRCRMHFIVAL